MSLRREPIHAYGGIEHTQPGPFDGCLMCELETALSAAQDAYDEGTRVGSSYRERRLTEKWNDAEARLAETTALLADAMDALELAERLAYLHRPEWVATFQDLLARYRSLEQEAAGGEA